MLVRDNVHIGEDQLTLAVFGLFRYLPTELWFAQFISELKLKNPHFELKAKGQLIEVELWPAYEVPAKWQLPFRAGHTAREHHEAKKVTVIPDARMQIDEALILIESEFSHELEGEQLFQHFALASEDAKEFYILLVNQAVSRPKDAGDSLIEIKRRANTLESYIERRCQSIGLQFSRVEIKKRVLWCNWQSLYSVIRAVEIGLNFAPTVNKAFATMTSDVCDLLEQERLIPPNFNTLNLMTELSIDASLIPTIVESGSIVEFLMQINIDPASLPALQDVSK